MNLLSCYEQAIAAGDISDDAVQRQVLVSMQLLSDELAKIKPSRFIWGRKTRIKGLYLYGAVGVGKTYLMDLFFHSVDEKKKARFHFHHFMQQVDAQLRRRQGQKNPLKAIAADFAKTTRLLCFDEFFVHDVAYAMILAELLQALFAEGVVLVATSNTEPDKLYPNGVHRERFLPAIQLIKKNCTVMDLGAKRDYRLGRSPSFDAYLFPLGADTEQRLTEQFARLSPNIKDSGVLLVQNREIPYVKCAEHAVWFDFKVICNLPRSQLDYLELAERFDTLVVSNIPALDEKDTIFAILLVHFIDVMYDLGIHLILSAAVPLDDLYLRGEMSQEFKRTLSRLKEMQSVDYLRRHPWRHAQNLLD